MIRLLHLTFAIVVIFPAVGVADSSETIDHNLCSNSLTDGNKISFSPSPEMRIEVQRLVDRSYVLSHTISPSPDEVHRKTLEVLEASQAIEPHAIQTVEVGTQAIAIGSTETRLLVRHETVLQNGMVIYSLREVDSVDPTRTRVTRYFAFDFRESQPRLIVCQNPSDQLTSDFSLDPTSDTVRLQFSYKPELLNLANKASIFGQESEKLKLDLATSSATTQSLQASLDVKNLENQAKQIELDDLRAELALAENLADRATKVAISKDQLASELSERLKTAEQSNEKLASALRIAVKRSDKLRKQISRGIIGDLGRVYSRLRAMLGKINKVVTQDESR